MIKNLLGVSVLSFAYSFLLLQYLLSFILNIGYGFSFINFIILLLMGPYVYKYIREAYRARGKHIFYEVVISIFAAIFLYAFLYVFL